MERKPYLALLLACFAGPVSADSFDDFSFPEFDKPAEKRSLLIDSPASAEASPSDLNRGAEKPRDLPPVPGRNNSTRRREIAAQTEAVPADEAPAQEQAAVAVPDLQIDPLAASYPVAPQPAYPMAAGPSNPSPLLAYMQCSPNTCGDVWVGFAEQHRRDMLHYCTEHHRCPPNQLYCEPCVIGPHRHRHHAAPMNRYAPAACQSCDAH